MQGTKSLTFSMLDWGCQIFHGTQECQKELFIKSSDTIQSMRWLNHFLVFLWRLRSLITDDIPEVIDQHFFQVCHVDDFWCLISVIFWRIDFVHRKKSIIFQSICKNTFIQLKKGMHTWRMQSSLNDRSCVKRIDCKGLMPYISLIWNKNLFLF